jgi:DNA (cytosine-5)-methyltransferase 1
VLLRNETSEGASITNGKAPPQATKLFISVFTNCLESLGGVMFAERLLQSVTSGRILLVATMTRPTISGCAAHVITSTMARYAIFGVRKGVMPHVQQATDGRFAFRWHLTGGIELGLERTGGFETVWQVEIDYYARRVLAKHWPTVRRWDDVRTFPPGPADEWRCDAIVGGDPCQRNSAAGNSRAESLGGEFVRVVDALRPRLVLRENPSHVRADAPWPWWTMRAALESLGYAVLPFRLRACCFGAQHERERVFLLGERTDASSIGLAWRDNERSSDREPGNDISSLVHTHNWGDLRKTRGYRSRNGVPAYVDRMRCLGNAVVPQVAQWIGERILEAERTIS